MTALVSDVLIGFSLAVVLLPICRVVALRTGVVAHPRNDRWHRQTVPMLGGVAIAVATLLGSLVTGVATVMAVVGLVIPPVGVACALVGIAYAGDGWQRSRRRGESNRVARLCAVVSAGLIVLLVVGNAIYAAAA